MIGPVDMAAQGIGLEPRWGNVKLKYLLKSVGSGGTPSTDVPSFWAENGEDGYPWVAIADMSRTSIVSTTAKRVTPEGLRSKGLAVWPSGTLLMSMYASLGHVATLGVPAATNQAILALHPRNDVDPGYLSYWLKAIQPLLKGEANSNTQDNLNAEKVGNLPATKPPFEEQRRIAAFLDHETARIDELVREQERLQRLIEERRHSAIAFFVARGLDPEAPLKGSGVESVGAIPQHWQVKKLKHIGRLVTGTTPGNLSVADGVSSGLPWVRPDDFSLREGSVAPRVHLPPALAREVRPIPAGSSLISCIGRIGLTVQTSVRLATNQQITAVIPISVHERYLYYALNSIKGELERNAVGNVLSILNASRLSEISIPLPPVSEQSAIANYLDDEIVQLEALYSEQAKSISLLRERRSALISAAVTGQLDLSDWQLPEPEAVAEVA